MDKRGTRVVGIFDPADPEAFITDLVQEALAFHEDGADVIDLDSLPGGAFARADDNTVALLIAGLAELGIEVSVTTTDAGRAGLAADHGAAWIIDPSGTSADPRMPGVAAASGCGWVIGPWSSRRADWYAGGNGEVDAYADGLVRNLAALLEAGVRSERIVLDAGAGLSADDAQPWRMINHLDRVSALGYPVLIDARDEILAAMSSDDAAERLEDAAVGLTVLATGLGAWGIRVRSVERVAGAVQRMAEPRQTA